MTLNTSKYAPPNLRYRILLLNFETYFFCKICTKILALISIFSQNFQFQPKFPFLAKISSYSQNFQFQSKFLVLVKFLIFWQKFLVLDKISCFSQNMQFQPKFRIWPKFRLCSKYAPPNLRYRILLLNFEIYFIFKICKKNHVWCFSSFYLFLF